MTGLNQQARVMQSAFDSLVAFNFRKWPVFRMGYDAHVRAWDKVMCRRVFDAYHADDAFRARIDRERDALRQVPMPPMAGIKEEHRK